MKATKKIVGAACALVAAVALSAGSTFAWFTTNTNVSASGMKVQAVVPSSLYIANDYKSFDTEKVMSATWEKNTHEAGVFSTVGINLEEVAGTHKLTNATMAESGGTVTVKTGMGTSTSDGTLNGSLTDKGTFDKDSTTFTDLTSYAAFYPMTLYRQSDKTAGTASGMKLNMGITASDATTAGANDKTLDFLHCGVLTSYTVDETTTTLWTTSIDLSNNLQAGTPTLNLTGVVANIPDNINVKCLFVLWFEGSDVDCTNIKAASVHDINVSINFTLVSAT